MTFISPLMHSLKARASTIGTAVCVLLIGVIAAQPLLHFGLPAGADTLYHIQRTASLLRSWQEGVLFPRWSPDLAYGFGYPVFNYYAPLAYYFTGGLSALGLTATQAVTWIAVVFCCLQAIGTWLWLREHTSSSAAFIGSVSYTLAPYTISNIIGRGALAEHAALGIMPFVLWSIARLSRASGSAQAQWWLTATLLLAAFWLSHNVSALLASIPISVYLLHFWFTQGRKALLLLMPLCAALITAFFWVPVLTERSQVQLDRLYAVGWADYRHHFLGLAQLFAWPEPTDRLLVYQPRPPEFNGPITIISMVYSFINIAVNIANKRKETYLLSLYFLVLFIMSTLMINTFSLRIWESLEFLKFLQFPWRFHIITILCISFLFSNFTSFLEQKLYSTSIHRVAFNILLIYWLGFSASFIFPRQIPVSTIKSSYTATAIQIAQFEHKTTYIGTTTSGEYLPVGVLEKPPFDLSIFNTIESEEEYQSASRFIVELSSPEIEIHQQYYTPYRYNLQFTTLSSAALVFKTFYFPGWQAVLNGHPVTLSAQPPHGLLRVDAPPGTHDLEIVFASTPLRSLVEVASIAGFGLTLLVTIVLYRGHATHNNSADIQPIQDHTRRLLPWKEILLASLIVLGIKTLWVDRTETPFAFTRFDGRTVRDINVEIQRSFGDGLVLIGADMPEHINPTPRSLKLTLFWRAARPLSQEYSTSIHLVDALGTLVGQSDNQHPDGFPTNYWPTDKYGRDRHTVPIYPGTPPGTYRLFVKVYPYGQPQSPLPVYDEHGSPIGTEVLLGTIDLNPEPWRVPLETLKAEHVLDAPAGDPVALVAFNPPAAQARPGTQLGITFFWQAQRDPQADIQATLHFVQSDGYSAASQRFTPVATHPTSRWQAGDLWRGTHRFLVPRALASGNYTLTLQIPPSTSLPLSLLFVAPIARTFEPPDAGRPVGARFLEAGELFAELFAADVPAEARPSEAITIRLVWKATRETDRAYKVFLHVVDAQGNYASGRDSEPANWSRPTTSWVEGEYVIDEHTLNAPQAEGAYEVRVGLYAVESGERLPLVSGETFITLPQRIQVKP